MGFTPTSNQDKIRLNHRQAFVTEVTEIGRAGEAVVPTDVDVGNLQQNAKVS